MKRYIREIALIGTIVSSFAFMMSLEAIEQDQSYHDFADQRAFLGIPNFLDVVSNIPFAVVGTIGFCLALTRRQKECPWSWLVFFAGVATVSFGSGYYHWNPDDATLVWDRLPMTVAFMGLFIAVLSEYISPRIERLFLIPAVAIGISSVLYWSLGGDLRFYFWIQLVPLLAIAVTLLVFKGAYTHRLFLLYALAFYLAAKITELYDGKIFAIDQGLLSGHSLKHLLSSMAPLSLYLMLGKRRAK